MEHNFKNCESVRCVPESQRILYINCATKKENEHPQGTRPVKKSIPRGCWRQMHPGPMKMLNWTEPFTSRILTYYVQEMNIFHMNQATVESAALSLFLNCSQRHPGWSAAQTPPAGRPLALPPDSLSLGFRQFTKHHPFTQPPCC